MLSPLRWAMVRPRKFKKFFERVSGRGARGDCGGLVLARVRFPGGAHPHWGGPRFQAPPGQPVPLGFPRFLSGLGLIHRPKPADYRAPRRGSQRSITFTCPLPINAAISAIRLILLVNQRRGLCYIGSARE